MQALPLVLSLFLSSPKATLKFAAIRTLAQLAQVNPAAVQSCNLDMEKLINDDNRSVATFAITTLLKVRHFYLRFISIANLPFSSFRPEMKRRLIDL
jgi:hypothetical protein